MTTSSSRVGGSWLPNFKKEVENLLIISKMNLYSLQFLNTAFSGVVPRTFLGAVSVALPAGLIATVTQCSRVVTYHIARAILGLYVVWSFSAFRRAVKNKFGKMTGNFLVALTCTQFHILFYASRTLPNTFALCAVLLATAHWLTHSWDGFLWWAGLGVLVLRSELVILLGPMLLMELVRGKVDFKEVNYTVEPC